MPSPALLQAISRLDQAVSRAEAELKAHLAALPNPDEGGGDRALTLKAIAELDGILAELGKAEPAEADRAAHG